MMFKNKKSPEDEENLGEFDANGNFNYVKNVEALESDQWIRVT